MSRTLHFGARSPRLWLGVAIAVTTGILPPAVEAQQAPAPAAQQPAHPGALARRQANYAWDHDVLRASFSYRDVLSESSAVERLSSGLPTVIAMRAYLYREGADAPIELAARICRVTYDLWDEVYRVHVSEPGRERDQAAVLDGVVRLCAEARDLSIARRDLLVAGQPYFLGVVVDVNPVSPEMVDQMRRWMSRPTGTAGIGPSDALFGSFVQLFVRQIATSDRTLTFRTQSVTP